MNSICRIYIWETNPQKIRKKIKNKGEIKQNTKKLSQIYVYPKLSQHQEMWKTKSKENTKKKQKNKNGIT